MAADHGDGQLRPKIKISENPSKVTNPGVKKIVRFYNGNNRMIGDLLTQTDEPLPQGEPVKAHHPMYDYMKKTYRQPYRAEDLMVPVFLGGRQVYRPPSLREVRQRAREQMDSLEPEYKRLQNNEFMEALRDRTVKIDVPYITRLDSEVKIYKKDFNAW